MKFLRTSLFNPFLLSAIVLITISFGTHRNSVYALPSESQTPAVRSPDKSSASLTFGGQKSVGDIVFGPADLVAILKGDEIKVWDARSARALCTLSFAADCLSHFDARDKQTLAFSPTGDRVAVVLKSRLVQIYDIRNGEKLLTLGSELNKAEEERRISITRQGGGDNYARPIDSVAFSADGSRLFTSGSWDEPPRVWDATTGEMLRAFHKTGSYEPTRLAVSPDSRTFAVFADHVMIVFDSSTGLERFRAKTHGSEQLFESGISAACFADGGKTLTTIGYAGLAKTYDCNTGRILTSFRPLPQMFQGSKWVFSDDGKRLSAMRHSNTKIRDFSHMLIETWDVQSQRKLSQWVFPADLGFKFGFSYDSLVQENGSPHLWDISQDGTRIVTSPGNDRSYVWQTVGDLAELENSLPAEARVQEIKAYLQTKEGLKTR